MTFDDINGLAAGGRMTIDLSILVENYRILARRAAPAAAAAVVKADAYGLGARRVARALEAAGCSLFFVAHLMEALELKPALAPTSTVYILGGLQPGGEATCAASGATPVLNSLEQAWRWRDTALELGQPLSAALQIDSGMSRLGLSLAEVDALASEESFFRWVSLDLVMSHLACADEPQSVSNREQAERFAALASRLPPARRSLANSGGVHLGDSFHQDMVRLGVCLYGAAPNGERPNPMQARGGLDARVIQVREVAAGQGVGYGLTYRREAPTRIATLAVGYADGWPRALSNVGAAYYQRRAAADRRPRFDGQHHPRRLRPWPNLA
jgi:alanine racemase